MIMIAFIPHCIFNILAQPFCNQIYADILKLLNYHLRLLSIEPNNVQNTQGIMSV